MNTSLTESALRAWNNLNPPYTKATTPTPPTLYYDGSIAGEDVTESHGSPTWLQSKHLVPMSPKASELFHSLPVETFDNVAVYLPDRSLARLLRASSFFNHFFKRYLYRRHLGRYSIEMAPATWHAATEGIVSTLDLVFANQPANPTYFMTFAESRDGTIHPFATAIRCGHQHIVRRMLQEGFGDPNMRRVNPTQGPLACSVANGQIEVVKALLESELIDPNGFSTCRPLHTACPYPEILELILKDPRVNVMLKGGPNFSSSLFHAVKSRSVRSVWLILAYSPNYDRQERYCGERLPLSSLQERGVVVDISDLKGNLHVLEIIHWKIECEHHGLDFNHFGKYKILIPKDLRIEEPVAGTERRRGFLHRHLDNITMRTTKRLARQKLWDTLRMIGDPDFSAASPPEFPYRNLVGWHKELWFLFFHVFQKDRRLSNAITHLYERPYQWAFFGRH